MDETRSNKSSLPIRVIDVAATLGGNGGMSFVTPTAWDFHVISHTWSLDVRKLSKEIGTLIARKPSLSYNQAFQSTDLLGNSCYRSLMSFLGLLAHDGVQRIWFDALCINQEDDDEKSVEILRMGAYYSDSEGCYALLHGVAGGYKAWHKDRDDIPRWFTRVWTLQEFLLPKKLNFLIGELSPWTMLYLHRRIEVENSEVGFCKCCLLGLEVYPNSIANATELIRSCGGDMRLHKTDDLTIPREQLQVCKMENKKCFVCKSVPLIRRAGQGDQELVYFVDREAYLFIASLERWSPQPAGPAVAGGVSHLIPSFTSLVILYNILDQGCQQPGRIADQVRLRGCSNEEDRILGILGLLELDELPQLRTGNSLAEQLVQVAKMCKADKLIRSLVALDYDGNKTKGMSWAPTLEEIGCQRCDHELSQLVPEIEIAEVSTVQGLRLARVKILNGFINYTAGSDLDWHPFFLNQSTTDHLSFDLSRYLRVQHNTWYPASTLRLKVFYFPEAASEQEQECVGELAVNLGPLCPSPRRRFKHRKYKDSPHTFLIQLPISILLLGQTLDRNKMRTLAMVCLANNQGELHKIGLISFPVKIGYLLFETCGYIKHECVVGGFGSDLSDYVISPYLTELKSKREKA